MGQSTRRSARACRRHLYALALLAAATLPPNVHAQSGLPAGTRIDTIARGLQIPWALAFARDGRIFVTERVGRIRVIDAAGLRAEPWAQLPTAGAGLLGIAIAPGTDDVYVTGSFTTHGDSMFENRVYVLTDSAGRGVRSRLLIDDLPSARAHAGSALAFGDDGKLYVTLGDTFRPELAASRANIAGKILRFEPDGRPAEGNPWPGNAVFAYGLRNPQGLAWDPATQTLFATDHGPTNWPWENGRRDHDELNVIMAGENYGWPRVAGFGNVEGLRDPLVSWTPAIAPSGLAFYAGRYQPWRNSLLVGALRGRHLRRIQLERDDRGAWRAVAEEEIRLGDVPSRVRGVFIGLDGNIYVTTADQREGATPDDHIYRITLP